MASGMTRDLSRPKLNARSKGGGGKTANRIAADMIGGRKSADRRRKKKKKEEKANNKTIFRESPSDTRCLLPVFLRKRKGKKEGNGGKFSGEKEQVGQRPSHKKEGCEKFFAVEFARKIRETARGRPFPSKA